MNVGKLAVRAALGLCLATSVGACAHHGHHGAEHGGHKAGVIIVTGSGEARATPNLARASIGIEVRAASVQEALQRANAQMEKLSGALKGQGIAEADLRTNGFSVSYDRDYVQPHPVAAKAELAAPPAPAPTARGAARVKPQGAEATSIAAPAPTPESAPAQEPTRGSYVVNNQLEVTVRDVSKLGTVLSVATASGANNIWGIGFDIDDKRPLIEKARALAFENAKADAERIAALSGLKLSKLVRVVDGVTGGAMPYGGMRERAFAADSAVPVQAGQLSVGHQVELEYAVSPK